jgi:uncharacterized pyridoxal phosphate-containing UPF0001 family protein
VRRRVEAAGGDVERITIVAVTKGFGIDAIRTALAAGILDLGDNYAQELAGKAAVIGAMPSDRCDPVEDVPGPSATAAGAGTKGGPIRWHFLGPVQRNKVAALAGIVEWWHSVDRLAIGEAIAARRPGAHILVQVNATGETTKHGCRPDDAAELVAQLRRLPLDVAGLMTIGPPGPAEGARAAFRTVAGIGRRLGLRELSMGMTSDLEVAVQEGATMVRIGRGLFGPRDKTASPATVGS